MIACCMNKAMNFLPKFKITTKIAKSLMVIEAAKEIMHALPVTAAMLASLRESARLLATHYSTQIEGNRLTVAEVEDVISGGGGITGRERDETEVRNYYKALNYVEHLGKNSGALNEKTLQIIHGLVMEGRKKQSSYRDGQNVIRDSASRKIVYLPPEAPDVPALMTALVKWINDQAKNNELPIPIIAGLAHYQFATIHPYYDGNGRTARLLTTLILQRFGYGLKGIYSLEEYYAGDLASYYTALSTGENHNYYEGKRDKADLTEFLTYFLDGMAVAFEIVKTRAAALDNKNISDQSGVLRELNAQQRQVLKLFENSRVVASKELSTYLKISARSARDLCAKWVEIGFFEVEDPSKKSRAYRLADQYEALLS
jgi:cell filamentation protein, protein adenylyltransferase